jgi:hypothetical protein
MRACMLTATRYAGNIVRKFEPNINASHRDLGRKADAFLKYAAYDEHMVSPTKLIDTPANHRSVSKPKRVFNWVPGRRYREFLE